MTFFKHHEQHFAYTNDLLTIDIYGGIEGHLMDGLFATLKIGLADSSRPPIRHQLDLFNDNQMTRLTTKVCERLEVGHSVVSASLSEVVERLEAERLQAFEATLQPVQKMQPLTKEDSKDATKALKSNDLMQRTFRAFEVLGICGEAHNAMIIFLTMLSRMLSEPLSVICMAKSGSGKSYLVDKVAACLPTAEVLPHTQLTAASLYHFQKNELAGKVLLIEDLQGAKEALFPIRELQSRKKISKTMTIKDRTGELRTMTFGVEGPLCFVACSSYDKVYADNANQCLLLSLDNSPEQDRRIMAYQKNVKAGLIDDHQAVIMQEKLQHMQLQLKEGITTMGKVKIVNPYAPLIELPQETLHPRRTLPLILNFIEAVTFYHFYQREQLADKETGELYIETQPSDIQWAFDLLKDVLFVKSDELSTAARSFYQWLCDWMTSDPKRDTFYATNIREQIRIHPRTLNRHLKELTEYGFIRITGGNRHTTGYSYELTNRSDHQLTDRIQTQLNEVMKNIEQEHQKRSKPKTSKTNRAKKPPRTKAKSETRAGQNATDSPNTLTTNN
ncbi:MAG: hypothetical protein AAGA66_02705 [Bacteroidota bacterium]